MKRILILALLLTGSAFAAGGACPAGANYIDLTNPSNGGGLGSVTLASLGVTQCYYVSAAGADTNAGTSEASPWLHAPGMPSFTGSYSFTVGDGIILRGGDTWHVSSGSPSTGGSWAYSHTCTVSNPCYIGADFTWFSGVSFARPIINEDNPVTNAEPGSCSFADDGTNRITLSGSHYVILDMIEETGDCTSGGSSGNIVNLGSSTHNIAERLYIHGWSVAHTATDDNHVALGNGNGNPADNTNRLLLNVIDGADSTFGNLCINTACIQSIGPNSTGYATMWAVGTCWDVEYNVIRHASQGMQCGDAFLIHDNLFEFLFNPAFGGRHGNVFEISPNGSGNLCTNFIAYNNLTRNTVEGVNWWPQCPNYYIFNNVWENSGHVFGSPAIDPNGLLLSPPGSSGSSIVTAFIYNNTFDSTIAFGSGPSNGSTPSWASGSVSNGQNNQILQGCTTWANCWGTGLGNTVTKTDHAGEVYTGVGYSLATDFFPPSGISATVGKGNNLTSFCTTVSGVNAVAGAACLTGSSKGVVEVAGWGGLMAQYPAITANVRNVSAWDAGAYQFAAPTTCFQPCTSQSVLPLGTVPNVGGLTGVNTIVTDPVFGTTIIRATDANEDPSHPNISWQASNGGSNDDSAFNTDHSLFWVVNTNGTKKVKFLNKSTNHVNPLYTAAFPATNGMTIPYPSQFSTANPALLYSWNGTQLGTYTFDPPAFASAPSFTNLFNFVSGGGNTNNCLPSNFGAAGWTSDGGIGLLDSYFVSAWSSANYHIGPNDFQGTGFWAAAYVPGKGCFAVNTSTGAIVADQGFVGGTGLTCTGTGCTGTTSNSATDLYTIHAIKLSINNSGQMYMLIGRTTCLTVTCTGSGNNPYFQQVGSNVQVYGGDSSRDGGHWAAMSQGFANIPGMPQAYYRTYANPSGTTAQIAPTPLACAGYSDLQQHIGATNTNTSDTNPVMSSTATILLEAPFDPPQCPWWNELYLVDYNSDGLTHRLAHNYVTGQAINFDAAEGITEISQDGQFLLFNSDWMNTLGSTSGGAAIPNGPNWLASHAYVLNYVINPTVNNAANDSFKATIAGTTGSAVLNWAAACATTCTDGGVQWTNLGVPNGRSDAFLLPVYSTIAATPTFSPVAGTYVGSQSITLSTTSPGAVICWNLTGDPSTDGNKGCRVGTLYTGFLTVSGTSTVYATAGGAGFLDSAVGSAAYTITNVATAPTFSPAGGTYTTTQTVAISTVAGGVICYTTNGTTPATNGTTGCTTGTKYTTSVSVAVTETLKAIAGGAGYADSSVASASYIINPLASTPTFSPIAGTYTGTQSVVISALTGRVICYTADGSTPQTNGTTGCTAGTLYTVAVSVSASETLKAIAGGTGFTDSAIGSAAYVIQTGAAIPMFSPVAGTYTSTQSVTLSTTSGGAVICYNTNGAPQTNGSTGCTVGTLYTTPVSVAATETLYAVAGGTGFTDSTVGTAGYVILITAATPTFSPVAGTYTGTQNVTLSSTSPGATLCYTTNGTTPATNGGSGCAVGALYTGPVAVAASETLKVIAGGPGYSDSGVGSAAYTINTGAATPTFSPIAGTYSLTQNVALSSTSVGAIICFTINGATPATNGAAGCTTGTLYSGAVNVPSSLTIKTVAGGTGFTDSSVGTAVYVILSPAARPVFSPIGGTYASTQSVTITAASGGTICYTTDGTTPSTNGTSGCAHGTLYTGAVSVATSETLTAIAGGTGFADGPTGTAAYIISTIAATPTFNPPAGNYAGTQNVLLTTTSPGAIICWNFTGAPQTNGSTGCTNGTLYTPAVQVPTSSTLFAVAGGTGFTDSAIGSAAYVISPPPTGSKITGNGTISGSGSIQ